MSNAADVAVFLASDLTKNFIECGGSLRCLCGTTINGLGKLAEHAEVTRSYYEGMKALIDHAPAEKTK